ncbi:MAG: hypothetical protein Fur0046_28210 [Cyanobacteria bacterium J069]
MARQFRSKAALVTLFGLMAALGSGCGPAQIFNPTTDPAPSPTAALRASGGLVIPSPAPTASSPQDSITLKLGDRSFRVRQIQQQLIGRGHLRVDYPINQGDRSGNRYDEETAAAVAEFQKQVVGLPATGEATIRLKQQEETRQSCQP